jgi:hypothetical protein
VFNHGVNGAIASAISSLTKMSPNKFPLFKVPVALLTMTLGQQFRLLRGHSTNNSTNPWKEALAMANHSLKRQAGPSEKMIIALLKLHGSLTLLVNPAMAK